MVFFGACRDSCFCWGFAGLLSSSVSGSTICNHVPFLFHPSSIKADFFWAELADGEEGDSVRVRHRHPRRGWGRSPRGRQARPWLPAVETQALPWSHHVEEWQRQQEPLFRGTAWLPWWRLQGSLREMDTREPASPPPSGKEHPLSWIHRRLKCKADFKLFKICDKLCVCRCEMKVLGH